MITYLSQAQAGPPDSNWTAYVGVTTKVDYGSGAIELTDGNYLIAGATETYGAGQSDVWVIKMDPAGDTLWTRVYGDAIDEKTFAIVPTNDGGCVVGAQTYFTGGSEIWLLRLDANGNLAYSEKHLGQGRDLCTSADGGFVVAGYYGVASLQDQAMLMKVDATLQASGGWSHHYGGQYADYGYGVQATRDGGFILVGRSYLSYSGNSELYLIRTDAVGDTLWTRKFGYAGTSDETGLCVLEMSSGGFMAGGTTTYFGGYDVFLVGTNAAGDELYRQNYGGAFADQVTTLGWDHDGHVLALGSSGSFSAANDADLYLLKLKADGDTLWTATWGAMTGESGQGLLCTSDLGYLLVGDVSFNITAKNDVLAMKLGPNLTPVSENRNGLTLSLNDMQTAEDILTVGGGLAAAAQSIVGVTVVIDTLIHTAVSDLTLVLSHGGVSDTLFTAYGAGGADFINTSLHDGGSVSIGTAAPSFTGFYRPYQPLNAFAGMDPAGDWTLSIYDGVAGNTGTLRSWGLRFTLDVAVSIDPDDPIVPSSVHLTQNYPNPFNPDTRIAFDLTQASWVKLTVFDLLGRSVATLVDDRLGAGHYEVEWSAADHPSGVYFYRLTAGDVREVKKMLLLK